MVYVAIGCVLPPSDRPENMHLFASMGTHDRQYAVSVVNQ